MNYWHAGSGRGRGAQVDAVVQRDRFGLPYLPGKTLRGLLRNAVLNTETWGLLKKDYGTDITAMLFGDEGDKPGLLRISSASLPEDEKSWLADNDTDTDTEGNLRSGLYRELYRTAIQHETGTAKDQSLRGMEVSVPLILKADINVIANPLNSNSTILDNWQDILRFSLPLIRAIGNNRSRGLGRAQITLGEV